MAASFISTLLSTAQALTIFLAVDLRQHRFFAWQHLGLVMLDDAFRKQRARAVRDLAEKAIDPHIKGRLLELAARYEGGRPKAPTPLTPIDLQFASGGTGPER